MKNKRTLAVLAVLIFSIVFSTFASADNSISVFVTIADENGNLALTHREVTVSDIDGDGSITVNDALSCAHESNYNGGADAGYRSVESEYGFSLTKLWGCENGGSYGYYINDVSAMSLADKVNAGDSVYAYVFTDTAAFSDTYSYFDRQTVSVENGNEIELTLMCAGYDENWAPVSLPAVNAEITIDGQPSGIMTDENGKAVIAFDAVGTFVISAKSSEVTLVPPVCIVEVTDAASLSESSPNTGDTACNVALVVIISFFALAASVNKAKNAEK